MKPQTKRRLKLFLVLYLVIVLVAAVGTLGWFVFNRDVNVKNGVSVTTGTYLRVSLDGENYGEQVTFTPVNIANLKDVSSKDGQNFYWPRILSDEADTPPADVDFVKIDDTNCEGYYIVFDLHLRATEEMDVYLGASSSVDPVEPTDSAHEQYDRQSLYGMISADEIAGAARIAILELTEEEGPETETLRQVWIPNPEYELYYENGEAKFHRNSSNVEAPAYYGPVGGEEDAEPTIKEQLYGDEDFLKYLSVGTKGLATPATATAENSTPAMANGAPVLCHFNDQNEEKHLRVRIWFEGTDREADKALNGGLVDYSLQLVGIHKEACPTQREEMLGKVKGAWDETSKKYKLFYDVDGNDSFTAGKDKWVNDNTGEGNPYGDLIYSTDGKTWDQVDPTNGTNGHSFGAETYYIKFRETATEKESEYRTLILEAKA